MFTAPSQIDVLKFKFRLIRLLYHMIWTLMYVSIPKPNAVKIKCLIALIGVTEEENYKRI